jgi:hypothetical protein
VSWQSRAKNDAKDDLLRFITFRGAISIVHEKRKRQKRRGKGSPLSILAEAAAALSYDPVVQAANETEQRQPKGGPQNNAEV